MDLVFVSLDDDGRQLEQYVRAEPVGGQRSTYWLREGRERTEWLADIGLSSDPELPAQILVDPHGRIRCVATGAVEDGDFTDLVAITAEGTGSR